MKVKVNLMIHMTKDEVRKLEGNEFEYTLKNNGYIPEECDLISSEDFQNCKFITGDYNNEPDGVYASLTISSDLGRHEKELNELYFKLNHLYGVAQNYAFINSAVGNTEKRKVSFTNADPGNNTNFGIYLDIPCRDLDSLNKIYAERVNGMGIKRYANATYPGIHLFFLDSVYPSLAIGPFFNIVDVFNFDKKLHNDFTSISDKLKSSVRICLD